MALGVRRLRELLERAPLDGVSAAPANELDGVPAAATNELICLACGARLTPALANCGALRCHECRSSAAPLDAALLDLQRVLSGKSRSPD
jgi:hypothetical protein